MFCIGIHYINCTERLAAVQWSMHLDLLIERSIAGILQKLDAILSRLGLFINASKEYDYLKKSFIAQKCMIVFTTNTTVKTMVTTHD